MDNFTIELRNKIYDIELETEEVIISIIEQSL